MWVGEPCRGSRGRAVIHLGLRGRCHTGGMTPKMVPRAIKKTKVHPNQYSSENASGTFSWPNGPWRCDFKNVMSATELPKEFSFGVLWRGRVFEKNVYDALHVQEP